MAALLSLRAVSTTYWRGLHELRVLSDVSLDLAAGEFVAVYGQRRSGKTTLLRIAAGLDRPDTGTVVFDGQDLARLSRRALAQLHRERIGWVERAGPRSGELPIADYVGLPLLGRHRHQAARRLAVAVLDRLGVRECASALWGELSDAERTHVAIAHALVRAPELLLVDDPTAGLDLVERDRVVSLLRGLADDARVAVLMAAPDMPALARGHDVRSLSGGQLLASASAPAPGRTGTVIDFRSGRRSG